MKRILYVLPLILQTLIWIPTRIVLKVFAHLEVIGLENLKNVRGGVIFAPNHSSELDPGLLPASLPFFSPLMPMFYTSRERSFYKFSSWRKLFYGGLLFKIWGAYPVYPGQNDFSKALVHHIDILRSGKSVCLFPEGKRTRNGEMGSAKAGIAYLADATDCPIVPVCIIGSFNVALKDFLLGRKYFVVTFGEPILRKRLFGKSRKPPSPYDYDRYKEKADFIMYKILELKKGYIEQPVFQKTAKVV